MKLKQMLSALTASALLVSSLSLAAFAAPKRTAIKTAQQLMSMKADGDYYLAKDIDLAKVKWKPIRNFSGTFDGNGHVIKNLKSETYGLFASLKSGAQVTDVTLTDLYLTSKYKSVGGVASVISHKEKDVLVEDCSVSGVVASCMTKYKTAKAGVESTAGAIVGVNNSPSSVVSNCYSNAIVAAENIVGGIVGKNLGTIQSSGFEGSLTNSYNIYELRCRPGEDMTEEYEYLTVAGGVCGVSSGNITDCFSNAGMETAGKYGGIVGSLESGSVTKCVNSSTVYREDEWAEGGLIAGYAFQKAALQNCYTRLPNDSTVQNDVGKGKTGTKSYGVSDKNFHKISYFKRLGSGWQIVNGIPMPKSLINQLDLEPSAWTIQGGRLIKA